MRMLMTTTMSDDKKNTTSDIVPEERESNARTKLTLRYTYFNFGCGFWKEK
jgi:hypothetical protein